MVRCYYKKDPSLIQAINSGICLGSGSSEGHFNCCFPWDICLEKGVCYSEKEDTYATALCTDQTLQDPVCQQGCGGQYYTNLTYDPEKENWKCCHPDGPCETGANSTLNAPAPKALKASTLTIVDFIPTSTEIKTSTSQATSSASDTTSNPTEGVTTTSASAAAITGAVGQSNASGLSTGAKAGIGVGVAVVVLALLAAVGVFLFRRRRREGIVSDKMTYNTAGQSEDYKHQSWKPEMDGTSTKKGPVELGNTQPFRNERENELAGPEFASELDSGYSSSHRPGGGGDSNRSSR